VSGLKRDGWERFSIRANTKPDRLSDRIGPGDLLYPTGRGKVATFLLCAVGGLILSVILVLLPLAVFVMYTPVESLGQWPWIATAIVWMGLWLGLFVAATREDEEIKRWLADP
jgi:hypothetical protein